MPRFCQRGGGFRRLADLNSREFGDRPGARDASQGARRGATAQIRQTMTQAGRTTISFSFSSTSIWVKTRLLCAAKALTT